MTRRERLENRLAKREEWAKARTRRAAADYAKADLSEEKTGIPFGQPILVGHHSEGPHRRVLERADNAMRRAVESSDMAAHHLNKADGLARALDRSIFSDDVDATDRLADKAATLKARRDAMKRVNAWYKNHGKSFDGCPESADLIAEAVSNLKYGWQGVPFPSYSLSNIGARIRQAEKRAVQITRTAELTAQRTAEAEEAGGMTVKIQKDTYGGAYAIVTFAQKPARDILTALRAAWFHWSAPSWSGKAENLPVAILYGVEPRTDAAS